MANKKDLLEFLYYEAPQNGPENDSNPGNNMTPPIPQGNPPMDDMDGAPQTPGGEPGMASAGNTTPQINGGGAPDMPPAAGPDDSAMPPMGNEPGIDGAPMGDMSGNEKETTLDVDDLTKAQEKINDKVDVLGKSVQGWSDELNKISALISKVSSQVDANNRQMDSLRAEMERRNPTPKEKLEIRTKAGAPFDIPVDQYWDEFEKTHPNYEVNGADSNRNNGQREYVITNDDANDYDPYTMMKSLIGDDLFEEKDGHLTLNEVEIRKRVRKILLSEL